MTTHGEQVDLNFKDSTLVAVEYAFNEAELKLSETGELVPFTVVVSQGGMEIDDHAESGVDEVYASARATIKDKNPESYVFCYDGYVTTDDGDVDAIVCEVADKGADEAEVLAVLYSYNTEPGEDAGSFVFEELFGYAGTAKTLF